MTIICLFFGHRWSDWEEVKNHLERECFRCPKIEAKYRKFTKYDFYGLLVKEGIHLAHRYLDCKSREYWPLYKGKYFESGKVKA